LRSKYVHMEVHMEPLLVMRVIFSVASNDISHTTTLSSAYAILLAILAQPSAVTTADGSAKMAE